MENKRLFGNMHGGETGKEEWLTPPEIITRLGDFDLDPCAPVNRPWDTAKEHYTIRDDGLKQDWHGRVWLNPPYGNKTDEWMMRMVGHGNGVALTFARTDTAWFQEFVLRQGFAILFIEGRIRFHHVNGTKSKSGAGAPSCLIAYGNQNIASLYNCGIKGELILLTKGEEALHEA
jgi:hypothetical protein